MSKKYDKTKKLEALSNDEIIMNSFDENEDDHIEESSDESEKISEVSDDEFDPNNDEEDEKKKEKTIDVANGMANSLLRGMGFFGAAVAAVKDGGLRIYKESQKFR